MQYLIKKHNIDNGLPWWGLYELYKGEQYRLLCHVEPQGNIGKFVCGEQYPFSFGYSFFYHSILPCVMTPGGTLFLQYTDRFGTLPPAGFSLFNAYEGKHDIEARRSAWLRLVYSLTRAVRRKEQSYIAIIEEGKEEAEDGTGEG